ncbi:MAG TPA: hypothetical protein VF403_02015 [Kofleriaceae bacterium]
MLAKTAHTPMTYLVGVTFYNLVTGFCYSAFTATGLADTRFGNIDGQFICDAALNLAGVAVLAFVFWKLGSFGKRSAELKAQKA